MIKWERAEAVVAVDGDFFTTVVIFDDPASELPLSAVGTFEESSQAPDPVARRLVPVEALLM